MDTKCSSPNLGNATNPIAVYTNPAYMVTIVTAAPGDQEVNRRELSAPAEGAGQHSVTSINNYGYGFCELVGATLGGCRAALFRRLWRQSSCALPLPSLPPTVTITNATTLHWRFETAVPIVNSTAPGYTDDLWLVVENHGPRSNLPPA